MDDMEFLVTEKGLDLLRYLNNGEFDSEEARDEFERFFSFLSAKIYAPTNEVKKIVKEFLGDILISDARDLQ